jgi:kynureninase
VDEHAAKQLSAQLREGESESPVAAASGLSDTAAALERAEFAVPPDIAYFNTATMSPQLHRVRAASQIALDRRSRPWSIAAEDWFIDVERLRGLFADMIGANTEGIALVPSTSYGFAVAARNLPLAPADRVLVLAEEYPSGIWRAATRAVAAEILTVHRETGQT